MARDGNLLSQHTIGVEILGQTRTGRGAVLEELNGPH